MWKIERSTLDLNQGLGMSQVSDEIKCINVILQHSILAAPFWILAADRLVSYHGLLRGCKRS